MDPARMFKESLTSRPELENSQVIRVGLVASRQFPLRPRLQKWRRRDVWLRASQAGADTRARSWNPINRTPERVDQEIR